MAVGSKVALRSRGVGSSTARFGRASGRIRTSTRWATARRGSSARSPNSSASREAIETSDEQAPVRACHRYLGARKDQLNYREALAEGLPIGSGEIESAHRYVAQKRLKLPGAWWRVEHAENMLALRINRLNGDWDAYWAALAAKPPAPANLNRPKVSPNVAAQSHNFGSHPILPEDFRILT